MWLFVFLCTNTMYSYICKYAYTRSDANVKEFHIDSYFQVFGQSYLRLEDQLCYIVNTIEAISKLENNSDALIPTDPIEL